MSAHDHHKHCCKHTQLAYCEVCKVAYCKQCGKEWREYPYIYSPYLTYTISPTATYGGTTTYGSTSDAITYNHSHNHEGEI